MQFRVHEVFTPVLGSHSVDIVLPKHGLSRPNCADWSSGQYFGGRNAWLGLQHTDC